MDDGERSVWAIVGICLTVPVLALLSAAWSGYALTILWGWFIMPQFGLAALAVWPAAGVCLVVGYLTGQAVYHKESPPLWFLVTQAVLKPAMALFVGWIIHLFV